MRFFRIIPLLAATLFAGCTGSHGSSTLPSTPAQAAKGTGTATFVIKIPETSTAPTSTLRSTASVRPQYVSPATQSITIDISGPTNVNETANLTIGSSGCTSSLASTVCTLTVPGLLPGDYSATLTTYDATGGTGNVLSAAQSVAFTIVAGESNTISLTLSGVPASTLVVSADANATANGSGGYNLIGQGARKFIVESLDADGNIIFGAGAPLFAIGTPSGSLSGVATSPSTTTSSAPNNFTVTPPTKFGSGSASFTVTPTFTGQATNGCTQTGANCSAVTVTVNMQWLNALFVANFSGGTTVTEYPSTDYTTASPTIISHQINGPYSLALDSSGDLFVGNVDGGNGTVTEYPAGNYTTASPTVISTDIDNPYALALDSAGDLFVANFNNNSVTEYPVGNYTTASPTIISADMDRPDGLALDSSGDLFVANANNNTVTEYLVGDYTTASPVVISQSVNSPRGLAFDSSGDLFVANTGGGGAVTEYPVGDYTTASPTVISADIDSWELAFDSSGDLLVANEYGTNVNTVTEYPVGDYTTASPTVISTDINNPFAIALDPSRNLFVANLGGNTVTEYPVGNYTTASPTVISTDVKGPTALAIFSQP